MYGGVDHYLDITVKCDKCGQTGLNFRLMNEDDAAALIAHALGTPAGRKLLDRTDS